MELSDFVELFLALFTFGCGLFFWAYGLQYKPLESWLERVLGKTDHSPYRNWIVSLMIVPTWAWTLIYLMDGLTHPLPLEWARWLSRMSTVIILAQFVLTLLNGKLLLFFDKLVARWLKR